MTADPSTLEDTAKLLLNRADDLFYLGQEVVRHGHRAEWKCAKADRFREATRARRVEATRLAHQLKDIGRRMRAQAAAATGTPPSG